MAGDVHGQFIGLQKIGSMTCHIGRALEEIFLLQIVHQPIIVGMRGFCCARIFGKSVAGQDTLVLVIESVWWWSIDIL